MENFYARTVFFVKDAGASLAFYTQTLGFKLDWNYEYESRPCVFQVSFSGFELILNQVFADTKDRAGHGRVFLGLEDDQASVLLRHIGERNIQALRDDWGRPTLVIRDVDGNELFFWIPDSEWEGLNLPPLTPEG